MPTMAIRGSPGMSEILLFAIQSGQGRCGVAVGKGPREARIDGAFTTFQAGDQPALGIEVIDVGQGAVVAGLRDADQRARQAAGERALELPVAAREAGQGSGAALL